MEEHYGLFNLPSEAPKLSHTYCALNMFYTNIPLTFSF